MFVWATDDFDLVQLSQYSFFYIGHLTLFFGWELQLDADVISSIYCSLESIHAALAILVHDGMPKQLYKEEV